MHVKNSTLEVAVFTFIILIKLMAIKNTPKDTWLKCNISIASNVEQKELVLIVKVINVNSHNWFHINKNPVIKLKKHSIILVYILLYVIKT